MPVYALEDTETQEQFEITMSYDDLEPFLKDNPQLNQVFKMNLVDPVGIGVSKPPVDFQKYVLNKVKNVPGAQKDVIEKRWQIAKEI
jgi:hypothetical protein